MRSNVLAAAMAMVMAANAGSPPPSGTPTTWDPAYKAAGITLNFADMTATGGTNIQLVRASQSLPSGKTYWEMRHVTTGASGALVNASGLIESAVATSVQVGGPGANLGLYTNAATLYYNNSVVSDHANQTAGVITYAWCHDSATGNVWVGIAGSGAWYGGGDPATGTSPTYTLPAGTWYPACTPNGSSHSIRANFGGQVFVGAIPSGFSAYDNFTYDDAASLVTSLIHFEDVDGSTSFADELGITWTPNGDAQIDTAVFKYGNASGLFDGTDDYLTAASPAGFDFGTGDFTLDGWVYLNSTSTNWLASAINGTTSGSGWALSARHASFSNVIRFFNYNGSVGYNGTTAVTTGAWHHVAWSRVNGTLRGFLDGGLEYTGSVTSNFTAPTRARIGASPQSTGFNITAACNVDEWRATKGVGRYIAPFTPPPAPFPDP